MKVAETMSAAAIAIAAGGAPSVANAQAVPQRLTEIVLSADARYDSNVARRNPAQAGLLDLVPEDVVVTPEVQVHLVRPAGLNKFSLNAGLGYVIYNRNTRLNRERLSVDAEADLALGPCQLVLTPSYSRGQSDLSQIAGALAPAAASISNTQSIQDYQGELRCGNRSGWRPVAFLQRSIGDNSNALRRISDYRTFSYGGGISYSSPVIGDYSLTYRRADTSYPGRPAVAGGTGFVIDRVTLSAERNIGSVLRAGGSASFLGLNPDQAGLRNFNSVGWSLSATLLPVPDLQIKGETARDIKPSLGSDSLYQVSRDYSLRATYALSSHTRLSLQGAISDIDYTGAGTTFGPALTRSVQRSVSGNLTENFSRRLGVSIDVGYQRRDANGSVFDYDNFFAGMGLIFRI